jgi:uncharacterized membrane protein YkgB
MKRFKQVFDRVDPVITGWMQRWGIVFVRFSLGIVFLWFGALKFVPGLSPAEALVGQTVLRMTGGQYILKNLVLISAATVIGATVRGARFRD